MIKKHIPNTITLGNLACGCLGIIAVFEGEYIKIGVLVLVALALDFADGFVARLLKVASPIGKDLDSLADMVTFGVLPSLVLYTMMVQATCDPNVCTGLISSSYYPYIGILVALFSALRLANFNNDTRQSDQFIGVPTPANAAFIISLPIIAQLYPEYSTIIYQPKVLGIISVVLSYSLVMELPLIALKFKNWSVKGNLFRYILIITSILLIVTLGIRAVPIILVLYIVLSVIQKILIKASNS